MDHFAGLDVSVNETSVCIVDDTGRIVREVKVASVPGALLSVLRNPAYHFKRIGLEADMTGSPRDVAEVPRTDSCAAARSPPFDHLVDVSAQRRSIGEDRSRRLQKPFPPCGAQGNGLESSNPCRALGMPCPACNRRAAPRDRPKMPLGFRVTLDDKGPR